MNSYTHFQLYVGKVRTWLNEPITAKRFAVIFGSLVLFMGLVHFDIIPSADVLFPEFYEWLGVGN